jgi:uncharacterized membrane protein
MSRDISISSVVGNAWEYFKANASILIVALFIYVLISGAAGLMTDILESQPVLEFIASVIETFLNLIMGLGFARILLDTVDSKEVKINTLFENRSPLIILHYVVGSILIGVIIIAGLILLVIPGIYLAARLSFFTYVLLEQEDYDFLKAISTSWEMTENHVWDLVGLVLVSFLIVIAGILALGVGLIITIPITGVMSAIAYRALQTREQF